MKSTFKTSPKEDGYRNENGQISLSQLNFHRTKQNEKQYAMHTKEASLEKKFLQYFKQKAERGKILYLCISEFNSCIHLLGLHQNIAISNGQTFLDIYQKSYASLYQIILCIQYLSIYVFILLHSSYLCIVIKPLLMKLALLQRGRL